MDRKLKTGALIISLLHVLFAAAQTFPDFKLSPYKTNANLTKEVLKFAPLKAGVLRKSMKIRWYMDHQALFNTFDRDPPLDCFTESYISNDTVFISGYMENKIGFGFQVTLFRDSCIITSFRLSDAAIYKYHKTDKALMAFIPVQGPVRKLELSAKPAFQAGEVISGFVQIISFPFWGVVNGHDTEFKMEVAAWFRTAPLKKESYKH